MSLRDQAWWPEFCARLRNEPLDQLARVYGHSPQALSVALNVADEGGPATEAPWWPEAVRRFRAGESLREISRLFGVNLRRLRRGLARAGLRVSGQNVGDDGLDELAPLRHRLGKEPDGTLAAEAGVSIEAVQGERRRLGIPPYRNAPTATEPAAEVTPEAGPVAEAPPVETAPPAPPPAAPERPAQPRPAPERAPAERDHGTTSIRRVVLTATAPPESRPATSPPLPIRRPDDPRHPRDWRGAEPDRRAAGGTARTWRRNESAEPTVIRRPRTGGRIGPLESGRVSPPTPETVPPDLEGNAEGAEPGAIPELGPRERRGRLRLIRPEAIQPEPPPEPEAPKPRRRREPTHSPVRLVTPEAVGLPEALPPEPETPPVRLVPTLDTSARAAPKTRAPTPPPAVLPPPPEPVRPARPVELAPLPPEPVLPARPAELIAPPEPVRPAAPVELVPAPVEALPTPRPAPARPAPARPAAPTPPRARPAIARVEAPTPAPEQPQPPPVAPAQEVAAPAAPPRAARAWLVQVAGREAPLVILAEDIMSAARRASVELGPDELGRASITAVDML